MYYKKIKILGVMCMSLFVLSGCSNYTEHFATEPGKGSGWRSMSQTYAMDKSDEKEAFKEITVQTVFLQNEEDVTGRYIDRMPDETLKIWIAPHMDDDNNLFDGAFVKTIVKPGEWVAQKRDGI